MIRNLGAGTLVCELRPVFFRASPKCGPMSNFRARRFWPQATGACQGGLKSDKRTDSRFSAKTTPRLPRRAGDPQKIGVNPKKQDQALAHATPGTQIQFLQQGQLARWLTRFCDTDFLFESLTELRQPRQG